MSNLPWASHLASLSLNYCNYKIRKVSLILNNCKAPTLWGSLALLCSFKIFFYNTPNFTDFCNLNYKSKPNLKKRQIPIFFKFTLPLILEIYHAFRVGKVLANALIQTINLLGLTIMYPFLPNQLYFSPSSLHCQSHKSSPKKCSLIRHSSCCGSRCINSNTNYEGS